jgi:hypothetical protein
MAWVSKKYPATAPVPLMAFPNVPSAPGASKVENEPSFARR